MIVSDEAAKERLNSPLNLINRLKDISSSKNKKDNPMSLFGVGKSQLQQPATAVQSTVTEPQQSTFFNPFEKTSLPAVIPLPAVSETPQAQEISQTPPKASPSINNLLENSEVQIKLGLAHDNALALLTNSVTLLTTKLDDVKADKLPAVISAANRVVEAIRRERLESAKDGKEREVHYHFYTPIQKKVSDYEVIEIP